MEVIEVLYRDHFSEMVQYFRGYTGNSEDAADLAQDLFLKLSTVELKEKGAVAYMRKAALGVAVDWMRKNTVISDEEGGRVQRQVEMTDLERHVILGEEIDGLDDDWD